MSKYTLFIIISFPNFVFAADGSLQLLLVGIGGFLNNIVIPFILAIAFIIFVINVVRFFIIGSANAEGQKNAQHLAIYGIGAFVFILSFWGLVNLLTDGVGVKLSGTPCLNDIMSDYIIRPGEPCSTTLPVTNPTPIATTTPTVATTTPTVATTTATTTPTVATTTATTTPTVPDPTCTLTTSSNLIIAGESIVLSWTIYNGQTATISGLGSVDPRVNGSQILNPTINTNYTLSVTNGAEVSVDCSQEVTVRPRFDTTYLPGGVDGIADAYVRQQLIDAENSIRPIVKQFVDTNATRYLRNAAAAVSAVLFADLYLPDHTAELTPLDRLRGAHRLFTMGEIAEDRYNAYQVSVEAVYTVAENFSALSEIRNLTAPLTATPPNIINVLSAQARSNWLNALDNYDQRRIVSGGTLPPITIAGIIKTPEEAVTYLFDSTISLPVREEIIRGLIASGYDIIDLEMANDLYNDFVISENAKQLYYRQPVNTLLPLI